jgi:hypothetical protein
MLASSKGPSIHLTGSALRPIAFLLEESRSFAKKLQMDLSTVANVATALTVITGVGFGLVEAQRSRRARQERAAYAAVQALLSPEWMKSMIVVHSIPDGSSASAIEANAGVLNAAHSVGIILEGLGYSVYARIVPLRVAADLVGGTVRLAWRKLAPYVEEERRRSGSQKTFEWFQWLAIQLERHSPGKTNLQVGAQEAYRDWRP